MTTLMLLTMLVGGASHALDVRAATISSTGGDGNAAAASPCHSPNRLPDVPDVSDASRHSHHGHGAISDDPGLSQPDLQAHDCCMTICATACTAPGAAALLASERPTTRLGDGSALTAYLSARYISPALAQAIRPPIR